MAELNPYRVLKVRRDADDAAIEAAYNTLFDRYEPAAHAGDEQAVRRLEELNEAHDLLLDPSRRAAFDAQYSGQRRQAALPGGANLTQTATAVGPGSRRSEYAAAPASGRAQAARGSGSRRPRAVAPRRNVSLMPVVLAGIITAAVLGAGAFLILRGINAANTAPCPPRGEVVAEVNSTPIYEREFNERFERDRQNALSDPIIAQFAANNFQGITGTRMLDVIRFDALDKLINMEVIIQEAHKEGIYPSAAAQTQFIEEAKRVELQGRPFNDFLKGLGICEEQYNASVVRNGVYARMAERYMPTEGNADARSTAFINWFCRARQNYDVKINMSFIVAENRPCSSGLPSDVPLTDPTGQETPGDLPPEPVPTGDGPMVPRATP